MGRSSWDRGGDGQYLGGRAAHRQGEAAAITQREPTSTDSPDKVASRTLLKPLDRSHKLKVWFGTIYKLIG